MLPATNFVPGAPNATLSPFQKTNNPVPALNIPLHPSASPSPNTQQHNSEPTHPNALTIPIPVFAPNLTAPISHAPLINQPVVHNSFQNNTNQVQKVVRSVGPVPNMPNIPPDQNFMPNTSHWRFPQHRPSLVNQDINTVNSVPPNVQAHILPLKHSSTQQKNPIATSSNVVPGLITRFSANISLCWAHTVELEWPAGVCTCPFNCRECVID